MRYRKSLGGSGASAHRVLVTLACAGVFVLGHFLRQLNIVVKPAGLVERANYYRTSEFTIAAMSWCGTNGTGDRVSLILGTDLGCHRDDSPLPGFLSSTVTFLMREEQFRVPLSWMVGQTLLGWFFFSPIHR